MEKKNLVPVSAETLDPFWRLIQSNRPSGPTSAEQERGTRDTILWAKCFVVPIIFSGKTCLKNDSCFSRKTGSRWPSNVEVRQKCYWLWSKLLSILSRPTLSVDSVMYRESMAFIWVILYEVLKISVIQSDIRATAENRLWCKHV